MYIVADSLIESHNSKYSSQYNVNFKLDFEKCSVILVIMDGPSQKGKHNIPCGAYIELVWPSWKHSGVPSFVSQRQSVEQATMGYRVDLRLC